MTPLKPILTAVLGAAVNVPKVLAMLALLILMTMTFCDVISRSVFNAPIEASTELSRILLMVVVFAALPWVTLHNAHIGVDLLGPFLDRIGFARVEGLILILSAGLLYWPILQILKLAQRAASYGDTTEFLNIPRVYPTSFVLVFTVLTALAFLVSGLWLAVTGKPFAQDGDGQW